MHKILLEYPWLPKMLEFSREYELDWIHMSAMAILLSEGDPRKRVLDIDFMLEQFGPDSPISAMHWSDGMPNIYIVDLCTKWGLFQILGAVAIDRGYSGRLINFIDHASNIKMACQISLDIIRSGKTMEDVEEYFLLKHNDVVALMSQIRSSLQILLDVNKTDL